MTVRWKQVTTLDGVRTQDNPGLQWEMNSNLHDGSTTITISDDKCELICGPDVTDWFVDEIKVHVDFFKNMLKKHTMGALPRGILFKRYAASLAYKWITFKYKECPSGKLCLNTVTLCGSCIDRSDLGNIMFGATGYFLLKRDILIIAYGRAASAQSKTGGIGSSEDLASTVAGLQLGRLLTPKSESDKGALKPTTLDKKTFCEALSKIPDKAYINTLQEGFTDPLKSWIGELTGNNPLSIISQNYKKCKACPHEIPAGTSHSSFSANTTKQWLAAGHKDYLKSYLNIKSEYIGLDKIKEMIEAMERE